MPVRGIRGATTADRNDAEAIVEATEELLTELIRLNEVDLEEVAYVIVRLIESYTYLDLITGEEPDARRAEPVLRMLLR